ncbi:MAG: PQQ-binding-like beta-propeller repeat protein [Planctomycetia bacterium]|nr:PQQ-binding-like beta-propeller repeat protein [Planctomycetia bacterium]
MGWLLLPLGQTSYAFGQFGTGPVEISGSVNLDEADSAVRAHLERVKAYVADRQWDDAVETLRQVMENHGGKMIPLSRTRYINVADYCHIQTASLPSEALALYRQRVDPLAQQWYDEAMAQRNPARLAEIVEKMFCSSWADDALLALGELELEQAHHGAARRCWERLIEVPPARIPAARFEAVRARADLPADQKQLLEKWYAGDKQDETAGAIEFYQLRGDEAVPDQVALALVRFWKSQQFAPSRLAYPGTTLPLADIRARLVLVSIMEGSLKRAREELQVFARLHPDAEGRLAGHSAKYVDTLHALLTSAESWPEAALPEDWRTFAGSPNRTKIAPRRLDLGQQAWEPISLGEPLSADGANSRAYSLRRIGEDAQRLLSYHPLVVGDLVLFNNQSQIFAFNLKTGEPAWAGDPERPRGEIFADKGALASAGRMNRGLGVPRFTMTAYEDKLFARMGSQITSRPLDSNDRGSGYVACLDLAAQGRVVWKIPRDDEKSADDDKWSFEGSPLVDGADVYIAMRKSDVRPQAHVACFDAQTGRRRWRTLVCAAETAGGGQAEEISHNLLTLDQGTLYYNTNLGAVAALSARTGRVQWVSLYPRAKKASPDGQDKRTAHFYRDLNPCIYYQGILLVAPADCESLFALDAASGEMTWETRLPEDVVYLLGVGHGNLLASGDSLWWIDAEQGKVVKHWPDTTPLGYGRGILMGDQVVWPTRDALYVFDQEVSPRQTTPRDPIPLAAGREATGGNLVASDGLLLIAAPDKLFAFQQTGQPASAARSKLAARKNAQKQPSSATMKVVATKPPDP